MDFERASKFLVAADVLEAQAQLARFKAADFPYLKKNDREKLFKQTHKLAYPFEWTNNGPLTLADAAKRLTGLNFPTGKVIK